MLADHGVRVPAPARDDVVARRRPRGDGVGAARADRRAEPTGATSAGWWPRVHALDARRPARRPTRCRRASRSRGGSFDELLADVGRRRSTPRLAPASAAAIERHAGWAAGAERVVCHGDVHPGNVLTTAGGPVLLDWDLLCAGPPGWDHAMLLRLPRWGWPARWYDEFAAGYGRSLADDPVAVAIAELRLVAATLMRLRAGRADPAAMPEAQRRLAYWRGDPDAPPWTAV